MNFIRLHILFFIIPCTNLYSFRPYSSPINPHNPPHMATTANDTLTRTLLAGFIEASQKPTIIEDSNIVVFKARTRNAVSKFAYELTKTKSGLILRSSITERNTLSPFGSKDIFPTTPDKGTIQDDFTTCHYFKSFTKWGQWVTFYNCKTKIPGPSKALEILKRSS